MGKVPKPIGFPTVLKNMIGLLSASSFLLGAQVPIKLDPTYMIQARYPAGSLKKDTVSPGGNSESSNMPRLIKGKRIPVNALSATISETDGGVSIDFLNTSNQDEWMRAADGNMLGWLEALDGKEWKPIEYHQWSFCGNSYHRVVLPAGYEWNYTKILPKGEWRTMVRWVVLRDKLKLTSNMLTMNIPRNRVILQPGLGGQFELKNSGFPVLMPKGR